MSQRNSPDKSAKPIPPMPRRPLLFQYRATITPPTRPLVLVLTRPKKKAAIAMLAIPTLSGGLSQSAKQQQSTHLQRDKQRQRPHRGREARQHIAADAQHPIG